MSGHNVLVSSVSSDLAVWLLDDYVNTVMARESTLGVPLSRCSQFAPLCRHDYQSGSHLLLLVTC